MTDDAADIMNKMYTSLININLKSGYKSLKELQLAVDTCDIDPLIIWLKNVYGYLKESEELVIHIRDKEEKEDYTKRIDSFRKDMDLTLDRLKYCECKKVK